MSDTIVVHIGKNESTEIAQRAEWADVLGDWVSFVSKIRELKKNKDTPLLIGLHPKLDEILNLLFRKKDFIVDIVNDSGEWGYAGTSGSQNHPWKRKELPKFLR